MEKPEKCTLNPLFSLCYRGYAVLRVDMKVFLLPRWKNYWIRGVLSLAMISGFSLTIWMGPIALLFIVSDRRQL